ncbi:MAG: flagellar hook-associated protein FlgK [Pseudomonadaceae bacterium]|nr:MAG: flagellar hook-associated protein FlgK [Pseudomonadaceae bacterium]
MADLFSVGLSGLRAAQTNLSVTGHNISNVNTPGYSRQGTVQAANPAGSTGAGFIGKGASIVDIQRISNQFLTNQLWSSTSRNSDVTTFQSQIEELNNLLAGEATGITPGLQKVFDALQTAVEDPANLPARQLVLSEAEGLAARFNTVQESLATQNNFIGKQMGTITDQVNRLAASVADYNDSIAKSVANGGQPNDLLDKRDEAIRKLNELVGVTVVPQDQNTLNLFIGTGQPLVVGKEASSLRVVPGRSDPSRVDVQLVSGTSAQDVTSLISGGELGGLIRYRTEVLDTALNSVGRLALSVADEINSQLGQGLDLNGKAGAPLFDDINSEGNVQLRSRALPGNQDDNAQLNVFIADTSKLTTSDYEVNFTSDSLFTVRRVSDGQVSGPFDINASPSEDIDGFNVAVGSGDVEAGDRFLLTPTRFASGGINVQMQRPEELAFAAPAKIDASLDNRGTAKVSQPDVIGIPDGVDVTALSGFLGKDADGNPLVSLVFSDGNLTLVDNDGDPIVDGAGNVQEFAIQPGQRKQLDVEVGGFSFRMEISGSPLEGDSFALQFNEGVADNRNALKLSALQTASVLGKGEDGERGFSLLDGYGDLVQRIGTKTSQTRTDAESTGAILKQATNNRDSVSAVNLDEEATNLIKFEQYYNASAQVIQIARSVFDTLINSIR